MPTLRDLHAHAPWFWLTYTHCQRERPVVIVHFMIALGIDASADRVRAAARCPRYHRRGCRITLPSHAGTHIGTALFPYAWIEWDAQR